MASLVNSVAKLLNKTNVKNRNSTNFLSLKTPLDDLAIQDLILRGKNNDQQAFQELFSKFWDIVYHFLLKRTNNQHDAELLTLETFTKAFDKLSSFDSRYQFESWLFAIARNHHIDYTRKIGKMQDLHSDITPHQLFNVPSEVPNAEDDLIHKEKLDEVLNHLDKLKEDQRSLLEAFYLEDKSLKDISKNFGIPVNNLKVKIFRSRKKLLQLIENA